MRKINVKINKSYYAYNHLKLRQRGGWSSDAVISQHCYCGSTLQVWPGTVKHIWRTAARKPMLFDNLFSSVSPEAQPAARSEPRRAKLEFLTNCHFVEGQQKGLAAGCALTAWLLRRRVDWQLRLSSVQPVQLTDHRTAVPLCLPHRLWQFEIRFDSNRRSLRASRFAASSSPTL